MHLDRSILDVSNHLRSGEHLALDQGRLKWEKSTGINAPTYAEMESITATFQDLAELAYLENPGDQFVTRSITEFNERILGAYNNAAKPTAVVAPILARLVLNASKYGHKAANLMEIADRVKGLAKVPPFLPIPHAAVWKFLEEHSKIKNLFSDFQNLQGNNKTELTDLAKAKLHEIRENISLALDRFDYPELNDWLGNCDLAYRSSSLEDKRNNANAGGNASIIGVAPNKKDGKDALKAVFVSFFSEKSLNQRLLAQDDILAPPFMAAMVQQMIGEPIGGNDAQVFVSGVGFYHEAEGRTDRLLHVQAAPGLGEYVVNSMGPADSYYEGPSREPQMAISEKPRRLVRGPQTPAFIRNKEPKQSSLNPSQIDRLREISIVLRNHYGYDVDFEFVVDTANDEIYILQVRPIVHAGGVKPSFVEGAEPSPGTEAVTYGGGSARIITDASQIMKAETLPEANAAFLACRNKGMVEAVFIARWAPATSHEATIFRMCDIPIMVTANPTAIQQWLNRQGRKIVISPQQAHIGLLEFGDEPSIQDGWFRHPTLGARSLLPRVASTEVRDFVVQKLLKSNFLPKDYLTSQLLDLCCSPDPKLATQAVATLLKRLYDLGKKHIKETHPELQAMNKQLFEHGIIAAYDLLHADTDMQRLFARNSLQAIFYQDHTPGLVDTHSMRLTLGQLKSETGFSADLIGKEMPKKEQNYVIQLLKLSVMISNPEAREDWQEFLVLLAGQENGLFLLQAFSNCCHFLLKHKVMEFWINSDLFASSNAAEAKAVVRTLSEDLQTDLKSFDWLELQSKELQSLTAQLPLWSDPEKFFSLKADINSIIDELGSSLEGQFDNSRELGRAATLSLVLEYVSVLDTSVKNLISSPQYSNAMLETKVHRFSLLLTPMADLLRSLCCILPKSPIKDRLKVHASLCEEFIQGYADSISPIIGRRRQEQLEALFVEKVTFSVSEFQMRPTVQEIDSLAEAHTLLHQDLLLALSILNSPYLTQPAVLSAEMESIHQAVQDIASKIDTLSKWTGQVLTDTKVEFPWKTMKLNLPLQFHSVEFLIREHFRTGEATIRIDFSGSNDYTFDPVDRMNMVCAFAALVASGYELSFLPGHQPYYDGVASRFTWSLPGSVFGDRSFQKNLAKHLQSMVLLTMPHHCIDNPPMNLTLQVTNERFHEKPHLVPSSRERLKSLVDLIQVHDRDFKAPITAAACKDLPILTPLLFSEGTSPTPEDQDLAGEIISRSLHDVRITEWTVRDCWGILPFKRSGDLDQELKSIIDRWPEDRIAHFCRAWFRDYLGLATHQEPPPWTEVGYEFFSGILFKLYANEDARPSVTETLKFIFVDHLHSTMGRCDKWRGDLSSLKAIESAFPARKAITPKVEQILNDMKQRRPGQVLVFDAQSYREAHSTLIKQRKNKTAASLILDTLQRLSLNSEAPLPLGEQAKATLSKTLIWDLIPLMKDPSDNKQLLQMADIHWLFESGLWEILILGFPPNTQGLPSDTSLSLAIDYLALFNPDEEAWHWTALNIEEIGAFKTLSELDRLPTTVKLSFCEVLIRDQITNPESALSPTMLDFAWTQILQLYRDPESTVLAQRTIESLINHYSMDFILNTNYEELLERISAAEAYLPHLGTSITKQFLETPRDARFGVLGGLSIGSAADLRSMRTEADTESLIYLCERVLSLQCSGGLRKLAGAVNFNFDRSDQGELVHLCCETLADFLFLDSFVEDAEYTFIYALNQGGHKNHEEVLPILAYLSSQWGEIQASLAYRDFHRSVPEDLLQTILFLVTRQVNKNGLNTILRFLDNIGPAFIWRLEQMPNQQKEFTKILRAFKSQHRQV